jgi:hypothetical protein
MCNVIRPPTHTPLLVGIRTEVSCVFFIHPFILSSPVLLCNFVTLTVFLYQPYCAKHRKCRMLAVTVAQVLQFLAPFCYKECTGLSGWTAFTALSSTLSLGSSVGRQKTRTAMAFGRCNVAVITPWMLHVLWNWIWDEVNADYHVRD